MRLLSRPYSRETAFEAWDWQGEVDTVSGRQAIEKWYAVTFAANPSEMVSKLVQVYAIGNEVSAISEWSTGPFNGYSVSIYYTDAVNWKIRMQYATLSSRVWS
jgi:hypothetical protein